MSDRECLHEHVSPNGDVLATVEQDQASCYFYLYGEEDSAFGMRACWVRNFRPAPAELDVKAMQRGEPPMLPRANCRHPQGAGPLRDDELRVVWSESGDAAALYEGKDMLAAIPCWSGANGFEGYARDCQGESPLCWELGTPDTNAQFEAFARAESYWQSWDEEPGPWPPFQAAMCQAYDAQLGQHARYYAIDGGDWPPKGMLRIDRPECVILVTLGVGIRAQPMVELHFERPENHRRVELGICLARPLAGDAFKKIGQYLSGQTNLPWTQYTHLDEGHTVPADVFEQLSGGRFTSVLLRREPLAAPTVNLPEFRGDPVRLLWLLPITETERELAVEQGSANLAARLQKRGIGWQCKVDRKSVC